MGRSLDELIELETYEDQKKIREKAHNVINDEFKFELEEPQKVVDYFGIDVCVANCVTHISTDKCFSVYAHTVTPRSSEFLNMWISNSDVVYIGEIKSSPNPDWWKESLIEV